MANASSIVNALVFALVCVGARAAEPASANVFDDALDIFGELEPAADDGPALAVDLAVGADTVRPGEVFPVAVRLRHAPKRYTYWANPGETGLPTEVAWTLPEGFERAQGPFWPAPRRYVAAGMVSYVVDGDAVLLYTFKAPTEFARAGPATLRASVRALVCDASSCTPTTLEADARVTVTPDAPLNRPRDPTWFRDAPAVNAAADARPRESDPYAWALTARRAGQAITLDIRPLSGGRPGTGELYFFEKAALRIAPEGGQRVEPLPEGGWRLHLPLRDDAPPPAPGDRLQGVLNAPLGTVAQPGLRAVFVDLPLEDGADGARNAGVPDVRADGWVWLFAFLGGLILNVMPCVFPVLGLKVMSMVRHAHVEHRAVAAHGVAYTAGVLLCFWAVAAFAIALGRAWGAQLQSAEFVVALCAVFVVMGLNMAGVFEVGMIDVGGAGEKAARQTGLKHSFLTGILATVTSTPCSAPFLGSTLAYALALPPVEAWGVFSVMALGFALPYALLTVFPALLRKLPKPGAWMETFRRVMAFPLIGTAAYLVWVYDGLHESGTLGMLLGMVVLAFACWLFGHAEARALVTGRRARRWIAASVLTALLGLAMAWPRADGPAWEPWSPERVAALRAEGRTVYVDFTARWCVTCQVNKRVFDDPAVIEAFRAGDVARLRADWTNHDATITRVLREELHRAAVPVNAVYRPGEPWPRILPDLLTADAVLDALAADAP